MTPEKEKPPDKPIDKPEAPKDPPKRDPLAEITAKDLIETPPGPKTAKELAKSLGVPFMTFEQARDLKLIVPNANGNYEPALGLQWVDHPAKRPKHLRNWAIKATAPRPIPEPNTPTIDTPASGDPLTAPAVSPVPEPTALLTPDASSAPSATLQPPIDEKFETPADFWGGYASRNLTPEEIKLSHRRYNKIQYILSARFFSRWAAENADTFGVYRIDGHGSILELAHEFRRNPNHFQGNATIQPRDIFRALRFTIKINPEAAKTHNMPQGEYTVKIATNKKHQVIGYIGPQAFKGPLFYFSDPEGRPIFWSPFPSDGEGRL